MGLLDSIPVFRINNSRYWIGKMAHSWKLKPLDEKIIEELWKYPENADITIDDVRGRMIWLKARQFLVNREGYERHTKVWGLGPNAYRRLQQETNEGSGL